MPRITLYAVDVRDDDLLDAAARAAERAGYEVEDVEDGLRVRKGTLFVSVLVGAFMLYVDFKVVVERSKRDEWALDIEWDTPWWTGLIGVERTRSAAGRFANAIEDRVERVGGEVVERESR